LRLKQRHNFFGRQQSDVIFAQGILQRMFSRLWFGQLTRLQPGAQGEVGNAHCKEKRESRDSLSLKSKVKVGSEKGKGLKMKLV